MPAETDTRLATPVTVANGGTGQDFSALAADSILYTTATGVFGGTSLAPDARTLLADLISEDVCILRDDFIGGCGQDFGNTGELGWAGANATGSTGGSNVQIAPESNHPGIVRITTGTTSGFSFTLSLGWTSGFGEVARFDNLAAVTNWDFRMIVRMNDVANSTMRIGLMDDYNAAQPANGIYWEFIGGTDTFLSRVTRAASSETKTASAVAPSGFQLFRLWSTTIGTVRASINGTEIATTALTVPTVDLAPCLVIVTNNNAGESLDVDYFAALQRLTR